MATIQFNKVVKNTHVDFIPPDNYNNTVDEFVVRSRVDTETVFFNWYVHPDFASLTSVDIVMIPDTTETIQADFDVSNSKAGEDKDNDTDQSLNETLAVTADLLTEWDISGIGTLFSTIAATDYVGIQMTSNTSTLFILGVRIEWES